MLLLIPVEDVEVCVDDSLRVVCEETEDSLEEIVDMTE